jgi:DNA-binding response OmpR family regulator
VLIVDRSDENREILQTVLERKGVRTLAAPGVEEGLRLAREHQPDLVVMDLEVDETEPENACGGLARQSQSQSTPLVVLGTCRRAAGRLTHGEFVAKPYHYGPLVRRIEELLRATGPSRCRRA